MKFHSALGENSFARSRELKRLLDRAEITFAGNVKLKIYGRISCWSGKRMKMQNRVFFSSEKEAAELGYRPCGHCMREAYQNFKASCK